MFKGCVVKIAQDGVFIGLVHRQIVVGSPPFVIFPVMALRAFLTADKGGQRCRPGRSTRVLFLHHIGRYGGNDNESGDNPGNFPVFHKSSLQIALRADRKVKSSISNCFPHTLHNPNLKSCLPNTRYPASGFRPVSLLMPSFQDM